MYLSGADKSTTAATTYAWAYGGCLPCLESANHLSDYGKYRQPQHSRVQVVVGGFTHP